MTIGIVTLRKVRQRDAPTFTAGQFVDKLVARRTTQGVHRHLHLRRDIPGAERIDLLLKFALLRRDGVLGGVGRGLAQLVPRRVVGRREIGQVFHAFLDTRAHRGSGREMRFLFEQTDRVAGFEMDAAVDVRVAAGKNAQQRRFAGAVETEDADFRPVIE